MKSTEKRLTERPKKKKTAILDFSKSTQDY